MDKEGLNFLDGGGSAGDVVVSDKGHAVNGILEVGFPVRNRGIGELGEAAGRFHARAENGIAGRRNKGETEGGVAGGGKEGGAKGATVCPAGFEGLIGKQLGVGIGDMEIAEFAEDALGSCCVAAKLEKDIPSVVATMSLENVTLKISEHFLLVGGGGFPAEGSGEVDGHDGCWLVVMVC